jgi:hypothetical protein
VATLEQRVRRTQAATLLAQSALDEARTWLALTANRPESEAYRFVRAAETERASCQFQPQLTVAMASRMPLGADQSIGPVSLRFAGVTRTYTCLGREVPLDWPYGRAFNCHVEFSAPAQVAGVRVVVTRRFEARLANLKPSVPYDRAWLYLGSQGQESLQSLAQRLAGIQLVTEPAQALQSKLFPLLIASSPAARDQLADLLPPPEPTGRPRELALPSVSYWFATAAQALDFLYPLAEEPRTMVLPDAVVYCGQKLELEADTQFRHSGVLACAGDLTVRGLLRAADEEPKHLVLMTLGANRRLEFDERPVDAALLAVGRNSLLALAPGASRFVVFGCLASALPPEPFAGLLAFDPTLYNGNPGGPFDAGTKTRLELSGTTGAGGGDFSEDSYRFSMAGYASLQQVSLR